MDTVAGQLQYWRCMVNHAYIPLPFLQYIKQLYVVNMIEM